MLFTSNLIGIMFARSLHYQFYSWIVWATPFLLWRSGLNPLLQAFIWLGQEVAWNIYPANELSSKIVVGVLALVVVQTWVATDDSDPEGERKQKLAEEMKKAGRMPPKTRKTPENGAASETIFKKKA